MCGVGLTVGVAEDEIDPADGIGASGASALLLHEATDHPTRTTSSSEEKTRAWVACCRLEESVPRPIGGRDKVAPRVSQGKLECGFVTLPSLQSRCAQCGEVRAAAYEDGSLGSAAQRPRAKLPGGSGLLPSFYRKWAGQAPLHFRRPAESASASCWAALAAPTLRAGSI